MWEAIYADPSVPLDRAVVRQIINDQRRLSRRWLYPIARIVSRVLVAIISIVKRVLPFRWMPLPTMETKLARNTSFIPGCRRMVCMDFRF